MTRKRLAAAAFALLLAACMVAFFASPALARFGGGSHSSGGSFSSGGSSSSSSSSGGGGGFSLGSCGVFIAIVVIVIIWSIISKNKGGGSGTGSDDGDGGSAPPAIPSGPAPADIEAQLRETDPAFSLMDLQARVNEMFYALQTAWSKRDLKGASQFIYPKMYATYENMIKDLKNRHVINIMETPVLQDTRPIALSQSGGYDFLTMLVTASAVDYEIDENTKEIVFPQPNVKPPARQFQERWTLIRKVGTLTKTERNSISQCPNCNAPATIEGQNVCEYCGTAFNNPDMDWVLSQIEQTDF